MNSSDEFRKSGKTLAMVVAAGALASVAVFALCNRADDTARPMSDQIVVVSAQMDDAPPRPRPNGDPAKPLPAMLDAPDATRLVMQYLPVLRDVKSICDADICLVSAEPSAAGAPLGDEAFSQLVQEDMPAILARAGHGLTEPIQIEELGPDQYRLRFRLSRQAR